MMLGRFLMDRGEKEAVANLSQKVYNFWDKGGKSMTSYKFAIWERIASMPENAIFIVNDFLDIADYETVRKTINRMVENSEIQRIINGVYYNPKFIEIVGEYESPSANEVATAIARKHNWTIAPSGNTALNLLGLSTQVPNKWLYVSDGRYAEYTFGYTTIRFKKTSNSEISRMSTLTAMIVQAIKALGKEHITQRHIELLRNKLSEQDRIRLLEESKSTTAWVYRIIRKIGE